MGEYFQVKESIKISAVEINIVERVKDSVAINLSCIAYYSGLNKLDSIICKDIAKNVSSKYYQTLYDSGFVYKTIYLINKDDLELYRIEKFIYGKESSLEFSNNKNHKGYKLTTTYDDCCIESGKLWHVNDTLTIKQIIRNVYDPAYSCEQFCSRSRKITFNPYYSIYLTDYLPFSYFDERIAGKYKEEYMGKQYISLSGDTIVVTETDSSSHISQTKYLSNDTMNFIELHSRSLSRVQYQKVKWIDTKYMFRRDDINCFEGLGSNEGIKHNISITDQYGTLEYEGIESTPIEEMRKRESNKKSYKYDHHKNWKKGVFEKDGNSRITVKRKIHYT